MFEAKSDSELITKSVLARGIRHARFAMENMGIMDCMANGIEMEQNIVLPATVQAINSNTSGRPCFSGEPNYKHGHTKDALKTGVRNVKESIKEGVKTDFSAWKIIKWIGTGIVTSAGLVLFDLSFANWYNRRNERIILHAFEHGSCPEPDVMQKQLIYREVVIKKLRRILEPISDHSSYHVVVGNHGTGKTTVVRQCARDVGKGVIYVDVPPVLDNFIDKLAKAIGYSFKEIITGVCSTLTSCFIAEQPRFFRVLDAFERGARKYK
ncbi:13248_t:CDS:2, partial [Dentiscutata erythropus]